MKKIITPVIIVIIFITIAYQWNPENLNNSIDKKTTNQSEQKPVSEPPVSTTTKNVYEEPKKIVAKNTETTAILKTNTIPTKNTKSNIATSTTDPYGILSTSGIAYTPAELKAIESAYAGVYDPAINTALSKVDTIQRERSAIAEASLESSSGKNVGTVVLSESGCDYYLVETSLGYSLLEWYGGFVQVEGGIIYGNINSYGMKDITNRSGRSGRAWVEDYMLSKSRAMEKYYDKCN